MYHIWLDHEYYGGYVICVITNYKKRNLNAFLEKRKKRKKECISDFQLRL